MDCSFQEKADELGCSGDDLVKIYDNDQSYFMNISPEDGGVNELRKSMKKMSIASTVSKKISGKPKKGRKILLNKLDNQEYIIIIRDTSDQKYKGNKTLKKIKIEEGVDVIGNQTFQDCSNLIHVTLPSSLIAIEESAFENTAINDIDIPGTVIHIGEKAFSYCMQLQSIRLSQNLQSISRKTFDYCLSLNNIIIPNMTESIGEYAFRDCKSLTNIYIPPAVRHIERGAFTGCDNLITVNLPPNMLGLIDVFPQHTILRTIDDDLSLLVEALEVGDPVDEDLIAGMADMGVVDSGGGPVAKKVSGDKEMYIESFDYLRTKHGNACFAAPTSMEDYWDMHLIWEDFPGDSTVIEDEADPNYTLYGNKVAKHRKKYRKKRVNNRGVLYVHKILKEKIIDCIKTCGKRFVVIPLVIRNIGVHKSHANMIIYDKTNKTAERYEPEGFIQMGANRLVYEDIDRDIAEFFSSSGFIHDISDYFGPVNFCPNWPEWVEGKIGHQKLQKLERGKNKKVMCAAWSIWYADMRLSNPDKPRDAIIHESIDSMKTSGFGKFIQKYLSCISKVKTADMGVEDSGGGPESLLEINAPTKEYLSKNDFTTVHCIKYREGSVMITDGVSDPMDVSKCPMFKTHKRLMKDIHYQYILYEHDGKKQLLLVPAFRDSELGTKHMCVLYRVPDGSRILCSGEMLRRGDDVQYATISSMYFYGIRPVLLTGVKEEYHKQFDINYTQDTVKDYLEQVLPKHLKIYYVHDIDFRLRKFNVEKMCRYNEEHRPKCLRYMRGNDCKIQQENPNGPDCEAGVNLCSNIKVFMAKDRLNILASKPPDTVIPESQYVYNKKFDYQKGEIFAKKHNIKIKKLIFFESDILRYAKNTLKMSKEQYQEELFSDKLIWPIEPEDSD